VKLTSLATVCLVAAAHSAFAQIESSYTYNGIHRSFPIKVRIPGGSRGSIQIQLLKPVTAEVVEKAEVTGGRQDLAKLFPDLWDAKHPTVLYAQLVVNDQKIGPALVLQPMLNPQISRLKDDKKTVEFITDEDGPMFNGYRAYVDKHIVFETSMGTMEFKTRPDAAPNTVWTIMELVRGGQYRDTIFHRIVAKRADGSPFVIQGGDPTGTGSGGPGFAYPLEDSTLPHDFGVISIARSTDPNTNGGQIFVCLSRAGTKHLDHKYATFGQLVKGAEVVKAIGAVPVGKEDRPINPPVIRNAKLVNAGPYVGG